MQRRYSTRLDPVPSESSIPSKTINNASREFEKLLHKKPASVLLTSFVDKTNWEINLSSRILSAAKVSLLKKGLSFAVTPANVPATEIVGKVESAVRPLKTERVNTVRRPVNTIIQQAKPPKPNIAKEQREALKSFTMVLPADTYHAKMSALINSGPYQLLNKDPTDRLTRKLSERLLTLKRNGHISETPKQTIT